MSNPVREALLNARMAAATPFERFCILHRLQPLPAVPAHVAAFVQDSALPIEKLWEAVQDVSRSHLASGLADPTAGGPVAEAINEIAKINPPRSWPKEEKGRFLSMPYDLQTYVLAHDTQREKEIRRAQNKAAIAQQQLEATTLGKPDHVATTEIETNASA